jgi:hypothetical protein
MDLDPAGGIDLDELERKLKYQHGMPESKK